MGQTKESLIWAQRYVRATLAKKNASTLQRSQEHMRLWVLSGLISLANKKEDIVKRFQQQNNQKTK